MCHSLRRQSHCSVFSRCHSKCVRPVVFIAWGPNHLPDGVVWPRGSWQNAFCPRPRAAVKGRLRTAMEWTSHPDLLQRLKKPALYSQGLSVTRRVVTQTLAPSETWAPSGSSGIWHSVLLKGEQENAKGFSEALLWMFLPSSRLSAFHLLPQEGCSSTGGRCHGSTRNGHKL